MLHIAIVAVVGILLIYVFGPVAAMCGALVIGGKHHHSHQTNSLVTYTLGDFKALGGFTTLGESVCRAAIYLQTDGLMLLPKTGEDVPWLRYKGVSLEIDGLDEKVQLAFEYDGPQHYSWREWCKMSRRAQKSEHVLDYYRARFYDRIKTNLCRERGIRLIRVSTWTTFDAMRNVIANALENDYSEHRPVDDAHVINTLDDIDTDDSSLYPQLEWGDEKTPGFAVLVLPTSQWQPHPYAADGLYKQLFQEELRAFTDQVREGLLSTLPLGDAGQRDEIHRGIMQHFESQLSTVPAHAGQLADVRAALEDVARAVTLQLCP
jgi:hypothetical protein